MKCTGANIYWMQLAIEYDAGGVAKVADGSGAGGSY